ncbi:MAG: acyltransferase family protein, partial [Janthinobacterium lividum]
MKYRSDIDGLRSIAVLSVVAFHYFPPVLRGGFIGVDLFFVISGYLISTIIFREVGDNDFSILKFYRRRINRIFPALSVVLIASLALGWIALFPDEYASLGKNTLASTIFIENIFLYLQSGYFDSDSVKKPLLHIWSLGVEEQFYIIYPPMLVLAHRFRILNEKFLVTCCVLSFVASMITIQYDQSMDFYLPLTRYWELSIGGILAWRERSVAGGGAPFALFRVVPASALSVAGLLLLVAGFFLMDSSTPFPGAAALVPVFGAALLIGAGPLARPNRLLLSNPVAVFVGKISYPLYLWHWPLIAFLYIVNIEKPEPPVRVVLILLAFVLATATWVLVETPIRKRHNNGRTAVVLLIVMAAIGAFGWAIALGGGFEGRAVNRINGGAVVRASGIDNPPLPVRDCTVPEAVAKQFRNCIEQHGEPAHFILLGDSKADALYHGLMAASRPGGRWLYLGGADATTFGAPEPLISDNPAWSQLQPQSRAAIDYIVSNKDIRVVLYTAALRNVYQLDDKGGTARLFNAYDHRYLAKLQRTPLAAPAQAAVIESVGRLVAAGKTVALLVDNPPLPPLRNCNGRLTSSATLNAMLDLRKGATDPDCQYAIGKYREDAKIYLNMMAAVKAKFGDAVIILDLTNVYCQEKAGYCGTSISGNALYGYT